MSFRFPYDFHSTSLDSGRADVRGRSAAPKEWADVIGFNPEPSYQPFDADEQEWLYCGGGPARAVPLYPDEAKLLTDLNDLEHVLRATELLGAMLYGAGAAPLAVGGDALAMNLMDEVFVASYFSPKETIESAESAVATVAGLSHSAGDVITLPLQPPAVLEEAPELPAAPSRDVVQPMSCCDSEPAPSPLCEGVDVSAQFEYSTNETTLWHPVEDPEAREAHLTDIKACPRDRTPPRQGPSAIQPPMLQLVQGQELGREFARVAKTVGDAKVSCHPTFEIHPYPGLASSAPWVIRGSHVGVLLPIMPVMRGQLAKVPGFVRVGVTKWVPCRFNVCRLQRGSGMGLELDACPWCGDPGNNPASLISMCECNEAASFRGFGRRNGRPTALGAIAIKGLRSAVLRRDIRDEIHPTPSVLRRQYGSQACKLLTWEVAHMPPDREGLSLFGMAWDLRMGARGQVEWEDYSDHRVWGVVSDFDTLAAIKLLEYGVIRAFHAQLPIVFDRPDPAFVVWIPEIGSWAIGSDADVRVARTKAMVGAFTRWWYMQPDHIEALFRLLACAENLLVAADFMAYLCGLGRQIPERFPTLQDLCAVRLSKPRIVPPSSTWPFFSTSVKDEGRLYRPRTPLCGHWCLPPDWSDGQRYHNDGDEQNQ